MKSNFSNNGIIYLDKKIIMFHYVLHYIFKHFMQNKFKEK